MLSQRAFTTYKVILLVQFILKVEIFSRLTVSIQNLGTVSHQSFSLLMYIVVESPFLYDFSNSRASDYVNLVHSGSFSLSGNLVVVDFGGRN